MTGSRNLPIARATRAITFAGALVAIAGVPLAAQQAAVTKGWQGWIGCWATQSSASSPIALAGGPFVCVLPTSDANVVDVATVAEGKVIARQRIDASGKALPIDAKECTGTKLGHWSADGRRVFLRADAVCGGTSLTTTGILAMTPNGEWLDIQSNAAGGGSSLRVIRYADAGMPSSIPTEIASVLNAREVAVQGARVAAGAPIGTSAVIEATKLADSSVVAAWLLERQQPFRIDASQLVSLAESGVPAAVTDAMVAVSNPKVFAVARPSPEAARADDIAGRRIYLTLDRYDPFATRYGYGYDPYRSGYGYGYGYGYGLAPGYGYSGYYNSAPIIIVRGAAQTSSQTPGHMVKGRGFVPDQPTSPSPSSSRASTSTSSGSSSGNTGSSSTSQPASQGSTERTAKPRP